jgi:hypothetical protein
MAASIAFLAASFSASGGFEQPAHTIPSAKTKNTNSDNLIVLMKQFPPQMIFVRNYKRSFSR